MSRLDFVTDWHTVIQSLCEASPGQSRQNAWRAQSEKVLRAGLWQHLLDGLHGVVEQAVAQLHGETGGLFLVDPGRKLLTLSTAVGVWSQFVGMELDSGEGLAGQVVRSGQRWVGSGPSVMPGCAHESRVRTVCLVPVRGPDGILGVLEVSGSNPKRPFDDDDATLAEALAAQAALLLENARLQAQVEQRSRELDALSRSVEAATGPSDLQSQLTALAGQTQALLDVERVIVWLSGGLAGDELAVAAAVGPNAQALATVRFPAEARVAGIAGWVVQHGRPALVADAPADARFSNRLDVLAGQTTRSILAVPFAFEGRVWGVVEAANKLSGDLAGRDLEMLQVIARLVALVVQVQWRSQEVQRLQQSQTQLVQAEKMAALGWLGASTVREINNPLQAAQACITLAEEELQGAVRREKLERYLSIAASEIERIVHIQRRIAELYQPAGQESGRVDLHATLASVLDLASEPLRTNRITVIGEWAQDMPLVEGNSGHLKQVLLNLVLNALDAMTGSDLAGSQSGGTLRIATALDQVQTPRSPLPVPAVRIEVADTGHGIPPERLEHIFEPAVSTRKDRVGLGLSIGHGIIMAHGGQMSITSQVGVGTTVTILLPIKQP